MREQNRGTPSPPELSGVPVLSVVSGVAATVAAVLIGVGFNVLGYSPPSFGLAKFCFAVSTLLLMASVGIAALRFDAPPPVRAAMSGLIFVAGVAVMLVALIWTSWRESDFASHQRQPMATVTTTTGPTPAPPSATHTATDTVATVETFKPGTGTREDPYTNADVWRITEPMKSHTNVEVKQLAKSYIGRWMTIKGKVSNVSSAEEILPHNVFVSVWVEKENDSWSRVSIYTHFGKKVEPAARVLHFDEVIIVTGQIDDVTLGKIGLDKCELISP